MFVTFSFPSLARKNDCFPPSHPLVYFVQIPDKKTQLKVLFIPIYFQLCLYPI